MSEFGWPCAQWQLFAARYVTSCDWPTCCRQLFSSQMSVFSFFQLQQSTTIYLRELPLLHNLMPFIYLFNRLQLMRHYEGKVFVKCAEPEKLDVFSYYVTALCDKLVFTKSVLFSHRERKGGRGGESFPGLICRNFRTVSVWQWSKTAFLLLLPPLQLFLK